MSRILIIEDHADIRRLIRWSLDEGDHEILEATNGSQGLAMAREKRPDLVLLDVMMPGGPDGFEVCRQIRADAGLARTPVLMLTARAQSRDHDAGQQAGADLFLTKPFSPAQLAVEVARLLAPRSATEFTPP